MLDMLPVPSDAAPLVVAIDPAALPQALLMIAIVALICLSFADMALGR